MMTVFWIGCALAALATLAAWIADYGVCQPTSPCGRTGAIAAKPVTTCNTD